MFNKLEFSDINRYLVSIGTILIALALLLPYFYLKENFGIIISEKDYESYTPISKIIIDNKQANILWFQKSIFIISVVVLALGVVFSTIGIWRWNKRQSKTDQKFDRELEKLEIEIKHLTPQEKEEKIQEEIHLVSQTDQENTLAKSTEDYMNLKVIYTTIEEIVFKKFSDNYLIKNNFKIHTQVKVNNIKLDLLLQNDKKDIVIEVKYINVFRGINTIANLKERFDYNLQLYRKDNHKEIEGKLIVIYEEVHPRYADQDITQLVSKRNLHLNKIDTFLVKLSELENLNPHAIVKF